jgi:hypothetical protein
LLTATILTSRKSSRGNSEIGKRIRRIDLDEKFQANADARRVHEPVARLSLELLRRAAHPWVEQIAKSRPL